MPPEFEQFVWRSNAPDVEPVTHPMVIDLIFTRYLEVRDAG